MFKAKVFHKDSGNSTIVVLVVLVVVAVGALAYFGGYLPSSKKEQAPVVANAGNLAAQANASAAAEDQIVVRPGNPVVAKLGDTEITRLDVFNFIQTLPPNTRQLPAQQLFPVALEQVINARIIADKAKGVNLDGDPEVKKQLEFAKQNIVRNVYVQKQVSERVTDDRLKQAYEQYKANFPDVDEVRARHILVKDEGLAKDLVKQLGEGADFAALAKEHSVDGTAEAGGELGYFAQTDVVPEFAGAAFSTAVGSYTKKPVKSDFGYHIIEVQEKRKRPPAEFEQAKPFLEAQLRQVALDEVIQGWRAQASVERFDINGDPIEPAAGGE